MANEFLNVNYENINVFNKKYFKRLVEYKEEPLYISYTKDGEQTNIPFRTLNSLISCKNASNIELERIYDMAVAIAKENIEITPYSASKICSIEHEGHFDTMLKFYKTKGFLKCKHCKEDDLKAVSDIFLKESRFKGRLPRIINEIADATSFYNLSKEDIVHKFNINQVKGLLDTKISKIQVVLLYSTLNDSQISNITGDLELCEMVSNYISVGLMRDDKNATYFAKWIAERPNTNLNVLEKICSKYNSIDVDFKENPNLETVLNKISESKSVKEVTKIEKAYKKIGFKLKDCKCLLKPCDVSLNGYRARILKGDDPKQVMLGHYTNCCQILGDNGETSMMYGLIHDKAGFFVIEEAKTGIVKAQAETWESNDGILVFDNIEFSNNADISLYKDILKKWLEESSYDNIVMGGGYNALKQKNHNFQKAPDLIPPFSAKEAYMLSYEIDGEPDFLNGHEATKEEIKKYMKLKSVDEAQRLMDNGEINYYTYLYSDVDDDKGVYWLKENGELSQYFTEELEEELQDYEEEYE